jgi:hypothetical protein
LVQGHATGSRILGPEGFDIGIGDQLQKHDTDGDHEHTPQEDVVNSGCPANCPMEKKFRIKPRPMMPIPNTRVFL